MFEFTCAEDHASRDQHHLAFQKGFRSWGLGWSNARCCTGGSDMIGSASCSTPKPRSCNTRGR